MKSRRRRQQFMADRKLQGVLLAHSAIYWFYCLFSVTLIAVCWIIFSQQPETSGELFTQLWLNCGPALLGSVLLLPLVMLDCVRLSNRFAGPMVRMQRVMGELAAGETPNTFALRPGDYWGEFADNFNVVLERIHRLESHDQAADNSRSPESEFAALEPSPTFADSDAMADTIADSIDLPLDEEITVQSIYSDLSL